MTNNAVFSVCSAVFSEECCMEKIAVIHLMLTHANFKALLTDYRINFMLNEGGTLYA